MYYYRYQLGKDSGHLCLDEPLNLEKLEGYTQITKEEYEADLQAMNSSKPANFEIMTQIASLKQQLMETDYKAIKYAEGWISEEDYAPIKAQRQAIRDQINQLEQQL